jgi:hypothetical protein
VRSALFVGLVLLYGCPPGTNAKQVSCRIDGGTACSEWSGAGLPSLAAIELSCTQQGGSILADRCPADDRVAGCRVKREDYTETQWFRFAASLGLADCLDAGRALVYGIDDDDAGTGPLPNDAGMACSMPAMGSATIVFTNVGTVPVVPKWVSPGTCAEIAYAPLPPGGGVNQPTFIGHVWRFRRGDANGPLVLEYTVTASSGSVGVR